MIIREERIAACGEGGGNLECVRERQVLACAEFRGAFNHIIQAGVAGVSISDLHGVRLNRRSRCSSDSRRVRDTHA